MSFHHGQPPRIHLDRSASTPAAQPWAFPSVPLPIHGRSTALNRPSTGQPGFVITFTRRPAPYLARVPALIVTRGPLSSYQSSISSPRSLRVARSTGAFQSS